MDANDADVQRILAAININRNDLTKARHHQERALALNPNYDLVVVQQGEILTWLGRPKEGMDWIRKAMRLTRSASGAISGKRTLRPGNTWKLSRPLCICRRWTPANMPLLRPPMAGWAIGPLRPRTYARIGKLDPEFTIEKLIATLHYANDVDLQHLVDGLKPAEAAQVEA